MICLLFALISVTHASASAGPCGTPVSTIGDYARVMNKVFTEVSAGRVFVERVFTRSDVADVVGGDAWFESLKSIAGQLDERDACFGEESDVLSQKVMPRVHLISFVNYLSKILRSAWAYEDEDRILHVSRIIEGVVGMMASSDFDPTIMSAVSTFDIIASKMEEYELTDNEHMQKLLLASEGILQYIVIRVVEKDEAKTAAALKIVRTLDELVSQRPAVEQRHFSQLIGEVLSVSEEVRDMQLDPEAAKNDESFQLEEIWGVLGSLCSIREVHELHLL